MINVGFIGTGPMGMLQAKSFNEAKGARVAAGSDISPAARKQFLEAYPDARFYERYQDLLKDTDIDAVVIAIPTGLHLRAASASLKAKKPTLLEKPMARTVAECRRLNDLAAKEKTLLSIAQVRRHDRWWGAWGKAVAQGRLGRPVLWRDCRATAGPGAHRSWFMDDKMGGGPLMDGLVHNYDFAVSIFGDPESVVASSIKLVPEHTAQDTGTAVIHFKSGDQLAISWCWGVPGDKMFDIIGPKGSIQLGLNGLDAPAGADGRYQYSCLTRLTGTKSLIKSPAAPSMFTRQAQHFTRLVEGKAENLTPGTEAIKAVAIAEAILKIGPKGGSRRVTW